MPEATLRERVRSVFGRSTSVEDATLQRIKDKLQQKGSASFRIYRTAAGFRVLATDPTFSPGSPEAEQLMQDLGADPAFVQLCRAQQSFRARLTPKPWRCGIAAPASEFPREDSQSQQKFEQWLASYEKACQSHATCRFVEAIGWGRVQPVNERVLQVHDRYTRAESGLPLA